MTVFSRRALFGLFFVCFIFLEKKKYIFIFFHKSQKYRMSMLIRRGEKRKSLFFPLSFFCGVQFANALGKKQNFDCKKSLLRSGNSKWNAFSIISNLLFLPFYRNKNPFQFSDRCLKPLLCECRVPTTVLKKSVKSVQIPRNFV